MSLKRVHSVVEYDDYSLLEVKNVYTYKRLNIPLMKLDTVIRQLKARNIRAEKLLKYYEEILNIRYKIKYNGKSVGNLNFFQVFDRIIMFWPSFAEEHLYELVLETGRMAYYNSSTTKFKSVSIETRHPYYYPEDKGYVTKEMSDSEFSLH
ncbi:hypothetical protein DSO57_1003652 [Entomophthora muscae]|uniref:Uncharacterized protein n=1 Tax=Entomophthora muscae TaxID=34485 RepID=A0ACC2SLX6_9FUNG|nr:hypothetical protein DSO57_1003652 [Entomophthora muscae]